MRLRRYGNFDVSARPRTARCQQSPRQVFALASSRWPAASDGVAGPTTPAIKSSRVTRGLGNGAPIGSIRMLVRQPRYTLLAVLTLAAGIGINSAMFGLLDAVYRSAADRRSGRAGRCDARLARQPVRHTVLRGVPRSRATSTTFADVMAIGQRGSRGTATRTEYLSSATCRALFPVPRHCDASGPWIHADRR